MTELPRLSPIVLAKLQNMKAQMQTYLAGVLDGMGLQGQFSINDATGELTPMENKQDGNPN